MLAQLVGSGNAPECRFVRGSPPSRVTHQHLSVAAGASEEVAVGATGAAVMEAQFEQKQVMTHVGAGVGVEDWADGALVRVSISRESFALTFRYRCNANHCPEGKHRDMQLG